MNNGFDFFLEKDDGEYGGSLVHKLHSVFWAAEYKTIKQDLWLLTNAVVSLEWVDPDGVDHSKTVRFLKKMVAAVWHCKDNMEKEKYTHLSFSASWVENPFRQRLIDQDEEYENRNRSSLVHKGQIRYLSKEEVRNFTLVIDRFFEKLGVLNWFALLDQWEKYSVKREGIAESGWDDHPLSTYEELMRLIEVVFLADDFYYYNLYDDGTLRNTHYFENDYTITRLDAVNTDCYNPLEQVNWVFGSYTVSELKNAIDYWFDCAADTTKIWDRGEPGILIDFHNRVICLYEAGWLLTQGAEVPAVWLDPNHFRSFQSLKVKKDESPSINLLSNKQLKNARKTLSKLYRRTGLGFLRCELSEVLSCSLQKDCVLHHTYKEEKSKIKKIIEILDVINKETCARFDGALKAETG